LDDPLVAKLIREALNAPVSGAERLIRPKPTAPEASASWSLRPTQKRSIASVRHQRKQRQYDPGRVGEDFSA
jgi:hypothetical protein